MSTLFVPISGRIKDLDVRINSIDHSFVGDLKVELVSPDNATTVRLIEHVGGPNNGGDDLVNTVFDDDAPTTIGGRERRAVHRELPPARLAEVIEELLSPCSNLCTTERFGKGSEPSLICTDLKWAPAPQRVRFIRSSAFVDGLSHVAITLVVVDGRNRTVDWNFMEIGSAQADELRIGIRKQSPLKQGIRGEINAWDNMSWMECDLFGFRKKIVRISVQHQSAYASHRHHILQE